MPALLPAAVAALGSLDGQHRVSFAGSGGAVAVVFHHESDAQALAHLHSPLAKLLTSLARSSGATQDHVFTFAQADAVRVDAPVVFPAATFADALPLGESFVPLPTPPSTDAPALAPRLPLTCAFALVCLRSTTLLV